MHLLPTSAWYALGLLVRDATGDHERALAVLGAVLDHQYDRPDSVWHGTFSRFAEWPEPGDGNDAVEWFDYNPNWRQFIGTTLLLVLRHHKPRCRPKLVARIDRALRLTVEGERDRLDARYTNIALMHAVLAVEAGTRLGEPAWVDEGHTLAAAVVARFDRTGTFDECRTRRRTTASTSSGWRCGARARSAGRCRGRSAGRARALAAPAAWFQPALGNLSGPFTRSYGMDMQRYVAAVSMWIWGLLGRAAAPLPDLSAAVIDHGHDLPLGPMAALLANLGDRDEIAAASAGAAHDLPRRTRRTGICTSIPGVRHPGGSGPGSWSGSSTTSPVARVAAVPPGHGPLAGR